MPGRYYEQWTLGDQIRHQPHRTVTETDNLLISALTHNPQPLHLDETYAENTEFGRIVVNGTFTFALLVGLSVGDTTLGTQKYAAGTEISLADFSLFAGYARAKGAIAELCDGSPNVARWAAEMAARPAIQRALKF